MITQEENEFRNRLKALIIEFEGKVDPMQVRECLLDEENNLWAKHRDALITQVAKNTKEFRNTFRS